MICWRGKSCVRSLVEIVEEYTSDTARLVTMRDEKVLIAPLFEGGIELRSIRITRPFQRGVEVHCVFLEEIRWSEIRPTPEPPGDDFGLSVWSGVAGIRGFRDLEIPVIGVDGWRVRVARVHDQADPRGEEGEAFWAIGKWHGRVICAHLFDSGRG